MRLPLPKPPAYVSTRKRAPWLLVSNCQVVGLGNCLNLLCADIDVEYHDANGYRKNARAIGKRLAGFERILVAPQIAREFADDVADPGRVWTVPTISFGAYHPDICYLMESGKSLKGPLGDYHSLIAYAAYRCGLTQEQALALYREKLYAALGYFNRWDHARKALLDGFSAHGFDLGPKFVNWSRNGAFMYSFNHPRIHCIRDIARAVVERAGLRADYDEAMPHDNLANGPIFPVYPEIGVRLGVDGSYRFKLGGSYRCIELDEFVAASYRLYREHPEAGIWPEHARALEKAMQVIREES